MRSAETTIEVADGKLPIAGFTPDESSLPGLVIIPSIFGVDDGLRRQAQTLAEHGALVRVIDPFWRSDPGPAARSELERARTRAKALDFEVAQSDVRAALASTRVEDGCNGRVVALGICFGGPHAFIAGARQWCDGVAAWHGTGIGKHLRYAIDVQCPVSMHFGGKDEVVPMDEVRKIEDAMLRHPDVELVVHTTAGHGFTQAGGPQHSPEAEFAAIDSVQRLLDRFKAA